MVVTTPGREAVLRAAGEDPQWLHAIRAAVAVADRTGTEFAGAWILWELQQRGGPRTWYPNFRRLVALGILEKVGASTRGGQRAYYRFIDLEGVRQGLDELDRRGPTAAGRLSFSGIGHSGRSDLSTAAGEILRADFPAR